MTKSFHKSHFLTFKTDVFYSLQVPKAGENFIKLCKKGYYDGTIFHRSIRNFMVNIFFIKFHFINYIDVTVVLTFTFLGQAWHFP
uniref:PPIase cyclophilin-type domain-containing protein n=1 Tax=Sinocyclocheilus grahami TaxID=75366 RepID=A0A672KBA2_SINGR